MAHQKMHEFLVALSKHAALRATLKKGGPAAEKLLSEAGLTAREKALVRARDVGAIKKYLADSYAAAAMIHLTD
jgi:hypothetical protein